MKKVSIGYKKENKTSIQKYKRVCYEMFFIQIKSLNDV